MSDELVAQALTGPKTQAKPLSSTVPRDDGAGTYTAESAAAWSTHPPGRITVRPNGIRIEVRTYDVDGSVRDLPVNAIVAC